MVMDIHLARPLGTCGDRAPSQVMDAIPTEFWVQHTTNDGDKCPRGQRSGFASTRNFHLQIQLVRVRQLLLLLARFYILLLFLLKTCCRRDNYRHDGCRSLIAIAAVTIPSQLEQS